MRTGSRAPGAPPRPRVRMRGRDGPGGAAGCDGAWGLGCGGVGGHGSDGASGDSVHSPPPPRRQLSSGRFWGEVLTVGFLPYTRGRRVLRVGAHCIRGRAAPLSTRLLTGAPAPLIHSPGAVCSVRRRSVRLPFPVLTPLPGQGLLPSGDLRRSLPPSRPQASPAATPCPRPTSSAPSCCTPASCGRRTALPRLLLGRGRRSSG